MNIYSNQNYPSGFYVYAYLRADGTPYYIGKGLNKRAWNKNHSVRLPVDKKNIIILESNLTNLGAFALERRYIKWYGRKDLGTGILRNRTAGGEGPSPEDRKGSRNPMFGRKQSAEQRKLQSIRMSGVKKTNHTKSKMSSAKQGLYLGCANPNFDSKIYTFINKITSETESLTSYDFRKKFNLDQGNLSKLISGKKKSIKNWTIV